VPDERRELPSAAGPSRALPSGLVQEFLRKLSIPVGKKGDAGAAEVTVAEAHFALFNHAIYCDTATQAALYWTRMIKSQS
jgi:hypothetical protein